MSRIRLVIDRVVLQGFDPAARTAFIDGLRAEFARVLANPIHRAALVDSHRKSVLRLGRVPLQPGIDGARRFGAGLARAIGKGSKR